MYCPVKCLCFFMHQLTQSHQSHCVLSCLADEMHHTSLINAYYARAEIRSYQQNRPENLEIEMSISTNFTHFTTSPKHLTRLY